MLQQSLFDKRKYLLEKLWGYITSSLVLIYITFGAGYEIYKGFDTHHVGSSLIFIITSACIFLGRVMYGLFSGARRTIYADGYGAMVMLFLTILKCIYP